MIVAVECFNARCEAFQHGLHRIVSANRNACIKVWPFATIADSIHALDKHYHLFCEKQDVTAAMTKLGSSVTFSILDTGSHVCTCTNTVICCCKKTKLDAGKSFPQITSVVDEQSEQLSSMTLGSLVTSSQIGSKAACVCKLTKNLLLATLVSGPARLNKTCLTPVYWLASNNSNTPSAKLVGPSCHSLQAGYCIRNLLLALLLCRVHANATLCSQKPRLVLLMA